MTIDEFIDKLGHSQARWEVVQSRIEDGKLAVDRISADSGNQDSPGALRTALTKNCVLWEVSQIRDTMKAVEVLGLDPEDAKAIVYTADYVRQIGFRYKSHDYYDPQIRIRLMRACGFK